MWMMTEHGFISVVQHHADPDVLTVRGRSRLDLERLFPDNDVISTFHCDYPWRIYIDRAAFTRVIGDLVAEIDYTNFKDRVRETHGRAREDTYHLVWEVLTEIEEEHAAEVDR